jgi:alpha-tubulin suppressor-like RCC1 family protein
MALVPALVFTLAATGAGAQSATVWAWGYNEYGQLGDGTNSDRNVPVAVSGLSGVVALGAGGRHSLAVKSNGTVWAWGDNWAGQLGDGTNTNSNVPVVVSGLSSVTAVAAGIYHSLALKSDGSVWSWGWNLYGQLGDGTTTNSNVPVAVSGLTGVVAVAAGEDHSLALKSDGTVRAWGANDVGQLGDGTYTNSTTPVAVYGLTGVVAIAAGRFHNLALKSDGTVWAWGYNGYGQLGDGTSEWRRNVPVAVSGLSGVVAVAAGDYHSLALKSDGTVWAWGGNGWGQLGDGTNTNRNVPVAVSGLSDVVAIAAGYYHSLAIKSDGTVRAWGWNVHGQLGDGTNTDSNVPVAVSSLSNVVAVAGGSYHSLAIVGRPEREETALSTIDRTGTITEPVILRAYLKRVSDNAWLDGKTVEFRIDGTSVGTAVTGATGSSGRADLNWVITDGPTTRTIEAEFAGDAAYQPSSGTATLTARKWTTKMAGFDRTAKIAGVTELKARLLRSDNTPLYNRTINFYVDGTFVIARPTNTSGYASYPYYHVPDGPGAGARTILSEWPGNAGYRASSANATLTALKATPYIWVMPKSVPAGGAVRFYAYFRRLPDYQKQEGKTVSFKVDGTWIADAVTGTGADAGIARYNYTTVEPPGSHTLRCEFAGDAWVDAGYGEATLTIY